MLRICNTYEFPEFVFQFPTNPNPARDIGSPTSIGMSVQEDAVAFTVEVDAVRDDASASVITATLLEMPSSPWPRLLGHATLAALERLAALQEDEVGRPSASQRDSATSSTLVLAPPIGLEAPPGPQSKTTKGIIRATGSEK